MKRFTLMTLVSLMLMAFAVTAMAAQPVNCQSAKIKSFDFLLDYSGSMMMKHKKLDENKFVLARAALGMVNDRIPELGYTGSIHTFAPTGEIVPQQTYSRPVFAAGFAKLKDTYEVFNRLTPMGDGIAHWSKVLYSGMPAPAAVIIVSDGENNRGSDPLAAAQAAMAANPDLTFNIISVADSAEGQAVLDSIAKLRPESVNVTAAELIASSDAADKFVLDVFCGGRLVLRSVQFAFDSSVINKESAAVLDELASMLRGRSSAITINGHTCNIGSAQYNQGLSERRAAAVKAYLVKQGIPADSMATRGYGLTQPKFDNSTEEGRRLNRRAEIDFR
ncbi:MAG: OmpA family protein [Desulfovibrionaceae bacterium]|nr:OmpA family protein [Desulfovibrionaceae bacterium]